VTLPHSDLPGFAQNSPDLLICEEWPGLASFWNGLFRAKDAERLRVLLNNLFHLHSHSAATKEGPQRNSSPVKVPESKLDCMRACWPTEGPRSTSPKLKNLDRQATSRGVFFKEYLHLRGACDNPLFLRFLEMLAASRPAPSITSRSF
jgi:hypothetical protein